MGKVLAAVFTAVVAPVLVVLITQVVKTEAWKAEHHAGSSTDKQHPSEHTKPNQVTAEGAGHTVEAAVQEACRNAVRMALPLLIDPDLVTKNERVIEESVLTDPESLVRKFDQTESRKEKRSGKDVYIVTIAATVDRAALLAKLKAANIKVEGQ
jgi:hypothetical protein